MIAAMSEWRGKIQVPGGQPLSPALSQREMELYTGDVAYVSRQGDYTKRSCAWIGLATVLLM